MRIVASLRMSNVFLFFFLRNTLSSVYATSRERWFRCRVSGGARAFPFPASWTAQALRAALFRTENTPTPFTETTRARPVARRYVKSRSFYASLTRRFIRSDKGARSVVLARARVSFRHLAAMSANEFHASRSSDFFSFNASRGRTFARRVDGKLGGNAREEILCVGFGTFRPRCVVAKRAVGREDEPWGGRRPRRWASCGVGFNSSSYGQTDR